MVNPERLESFTLGPWATNVYLLWDEQGDATLVDAGFDPAPVLEALGARSLVLKSVVLTHAHIDHIAGLGEVRGQWPDVPILIHPAESAFLTDPVSNLSAFLAEPIVAPDPTGELEPGTGIEMGGRTWNILHTPGHSPGGVTFHQPDLGVAIVGDTLFAGSVGRTDFPTSDAPTLMRSINDKLFTLPDDTRVLPGHGPATTVGAEKRSNPYVGKG